ncbi:amino acid adenylation domain protein [Xanthomonas citri pv. mangiferaeindicae LMG 941]|uniref:non-ribosomal peptide synthetase n=1 Tax=Xanthomonas citri TaxID=346 RepID=UPI0002552AE0|nr:non-ribosomal peptide synthetase [Xanthomonas citri]CCG36475.1 amino acid adenylation domain protein [Xanthomonas citri pv. mangiferaeindicae LMG 941]
MEHLVVMLDRAADSAPDRIAFAREGHDAAAMTYAELHARVARLAGGLARRFDIGERVPLLLDDAVDAVVAFFACQRAALIAVPMAPPGKRPERIEVFRRIVATCGARQALVSDDIASKAGSHLADLPLAGFSQVLREGSQAPPAARASTAEAIAYLQFTSGSVGTPKGVVVKQSNVLANLRQIASRFRLAQGLATVTWLPYFHDQGLVGGLLLPVFLAGTCRTMAPASFVQRPMHWIENVAATRAVFSGGPNFAYELCAHAVERDGPREDLDLSAWTAAFNGAEKVQGDTLRRFRQAFGPSRFAPTALSPCYGLAEATLAVSIPSPDITPHVRKVLDGATDVACGTPVDGAIVAIVNPESRRECADGEVGEIWVRGPMVAAGYWEDAPRTAATFGATLADDGEGTPFLRTGDLGYLRQGHLCVVSRRDDLIVVRGVNHYPADIEHTVASVSPLLATATMAAVAEPPGQLQLVIELPPSALRTVAASGLHGAIVDAVVRRHGIAPSGIRTARRGTLPRTTSGKIQRHRCAELVRSGALVPLASARPAHGAHADTVGGMADSIRRLVESLNIPWLPGEDGFTLMLDSLAALTLRHGIEKAFGVALPDDLTMGTLTLARLAEVVELGPTVVTISPGDPWALSPWQRDLWMAEKVVTRPGAYMLGFSAMLPTSCRDERVSAVFAEAARRNPLWHGTFADATEETVRFRPLPGTPCVARQDVSEREVEAIEEAWFAHAIEAGSGPLVRAVVLCTPTSRRLCIAAHHLVADETSMRSLLASVCGDTEDDAGESYASFLGWAADRPSRHDGAWWREALEGAVDFGSLARRQLAPLIDHRVHSIELNLDAATCEVLDERARAHGRTMASWLLSCMAVAIGAYTAHDDIVIACPVSLRLAKAYRGTPGALINTVPVRLRTAPHLTLDEHWQGADDALRTARGHAFRPAADILRDIRPERIDGISPYGRAIFNFVDARDTVGAATLRSARRPHPHADVYVTVERRDDGLSLAVSMYGERYEPAFLATFARAIAHLARHVDGTVTAARAWRAAVDRAPPDVPVADCRFDRLDEAVSHACAAYPQRIALRWRDADGRWQDLTYATLATRIGCLSARLRTHAPGTVGVMMPRCEDQIVAILSVLDAGHAWLPLDPSLPSERIEGMLLDSGCRLVVVDDERARERLPAGVAALACGDERGDGDLPEGSDGRVPSSVAAIIFTSGSTGRPKGVVVPHGAYLNRLQAMVAERGITAEDVFLQKTTFAFDVSVWEMFLPLTQGATLVLAPPADARDPDKLDALLASAAISIVHFVPTQLQAWLDGRTSRPLPHLRACLSSGEALQGLTRDRFRQALPGARLVNLYGPTECAIDVTCLDVTDLAETPPIGKATAGVALFVVDDAGNTLPDGVAGELCIAGPQLAWGYAGRSGLTAERFVPCPSLPGQRMYATGDIVWKDHDGVVHFLGRRDGQVKLQGYRIELDEIVAAARRHSGILDAAAVVFDHGEEKALGLVVAAASVQDDLPSLVRQTLSRQLPGYMVPRFVRAVVALPVTGNGKCDVDTIRTWLRCVPVTDGPVSTTSEALVRHAWEAVLGVDVGAEDDFFRLGGDSILAIRAVGWLAGKGYASSMSDIYAHPTPAALARQLRAADIGATTGLEPFALVGASQREALPVDVEDAYPLSMLQRSIVFQSGDAAYESYVSHVRIRGVLRLSLLQNAIRRTVDAHPFLRSAFDLENGRQPLQVVHPYALAAVKMHDLRDLPAAEADAAIHAWRRKELRRGFAWDRPPLLRFAVHILAGERFVLHMTDAALDGWCVATILAQIVQDYDAALSGRPAPSMPPGAAYSHFVELESRAREAEETVAFWSRRVAARRPSTLAGTTGQAGNRGRERLVLSLPVGLSKAAAATASRAGAPLRSVFLAAYTRCLEAWNGAPVLAGLELNGRPELPGGDETIGVFNNIVAWSFDSRGLTGEALVREVFAEERNILPHRRYPYADLVARYGLRARFQALFVYTDFHVLDALDRLSACVVEDLSASDQTYIPFTLNVNRFGREGAHRLIIDVDTSRIEPGQVHRMAASFEHELGLIVNAATDARRPAAVPVPLAQGLVGSLLSIAGTQPDIVAMVGLHEVIDYQSLSRRVLATASLLNAGGLRRGYRMALAAEADIGLAVMVFACWHLGVCPVFLDPADPPAQIASRANGCDALFTDRSLGKAITVPGFLPADGSSAQAREPAPWCDTSPAYVMHTSGSTGAAKGVVVSQGALLRYVENARVIYGLAPGTTVWNHSAMAQDFTVTTFIAPLLAGATVSCVPRGDLAAVLDACETGDVLKLTPSHLRIIDELVPGDALPEGFPSRIIMGGEILLAAHVRRLRRWQPSGRIFNEYGPTEACVGCSVHECDDGNGTGSLPIGSALPSARLYVLDADCRMVIGPGEGELYIGGVILAIAYQGAAAATAAAFLPDPFAGIEGARMYRTGDRVTRTADGTLRCQGRIDRQVKIRGYRVDLSDVEAVIGAIPGVHAVVAGVEQGRLACWVVVPDDTDAAMLRRRIEADVSPAMRPSVVSRVARLATGRNGKVDLAATRRAASAPVDADPDDEWLSQVESIDDASAPRLLGRLSQEVGRE